MSRVRREDENEQQSKKEDGEPANTEINLFSASPYLGAHAVTPLNQSVLTAINLGVTFWAASGA